MEEIGCERGRCETGCEYRRCERMFLLIFVFVSGVGDDVCA
jgi:hypothetical protein